MDDNDDDIDDTDDTTPGSTDTSTSDTTNPTTNPTKNPSSRGSDSSSSSVTSGTGSWQHDSVGWWYRYANGSYPRDGWAKLSGLWYYFNGNGYACTGWQLIDGAWYYLDPQNCNMVTGWHQDPNDTCWYYLDPNSGKMLIGWQMINGVYYFFNDIEPEQPTWTYNEGDEKWTYTNEIHRPYGSMFVGEMTPDGYQVDGNGIWIQ